jgi:hypothetical protein
LHAFALSCASSVWLPPNPTSVSHTRPVYLQFRSASLLQSLSIPFCRRLWIPSLHLGLPSLSRPSSLHSSSRSHNYIPIHSSHHPSLSISRLPSSSPVFCPSLSHPTVCLDVSCPVFSTRQRKPSRHPPFFLLEPFSHDQLS